MSSQLPNDQHDLPPADQERVYRLIDARPLVGAVLLARLLQPQPPRPRRQPVRVSTGLHLGPI